MPPVLWLVFGVGALLALLSNKDADKLRGKLNEKDTEIAALKASAVSGAEHQSKIAALELERDTLRQQIAALEAGQEAAKNPPPVPAPAQGDA